ncbi:uncharacterized protein UBRO_20845 [Ustilago bromivora]|uniref:Uncharacterized protein n=1 Tax=Ustilago bromivora TaxID=307758 RepID=A0A1K0HIL5_9BASI|nr:uncharacterized protein UBRO_20845 [Ustilago bromivora]
MNDAEQLCRICKHSKPLVSFRHQRFQHRTTSSCLGCRTGSLRATLSQQPSQPPADTSPPTSQDPVTTASAPSQDPSTTPTTVLPAASPPLPTPSTLVPLSWGLRRKIRNEVWGALCARSVKSTGS